MKGIGGVMAFKKVDSNTIAGLHKRGVEKFGDKYQVECDDISYKELLAETIRTARIGKNITQSELAKLVNRKPQKISEYERSIKIPSVINLMEIAKALHCKVVIDPDDTKHPIKMECM